MPYTFFNDIKDHTNMPNNTFKYIYYILLFKNEIFSGKYIVKKKSTAWTLLAKKIILPSKSPV